MQNKRKIRSAWTAKQQKLEKKNKRRLQTEDFPCQNPLRYTKLARIT